MDNIRQSFIVTVRRRALNDDNYIGASVPKVGFFAGFITARLETKTKEMRLAVVQAITGLTITSYKQLTSRYIDIIVEEVQHDTNDIIHIIEEDCKRLLESAPDGTTARDLYPWDLPTLDVSIL